jgi:hypothetical protein
MRSNQQAPDEITNQTNSYISLQLVSESTWVLKETFARV